MATLKLRHIEEYDGIEFQILLNGKLAHADVIGRSKEDAINRPFYDLINRKLGGKVEETFDTDIDIIEVLSLLPEDYGYMENNDVKSFVRRAKASMLVDAIEKLSKSK